MDSLISVKNLSKQFGNNLVLDDISFEVKKGSVFALLGSNGAGKTTTINILSTLLLPDSGTLTIGGQDIVREDGYVRSMISVTGQYAAVDELLDAYENMWMIGRFSHLSDATIKKRSTKLLKKLDLEDAAHRRTGTYSGGMRRRLDLATSLLAEPSLIFLDEPTTGLDPRSRKKIWELIAGLVKNGTTIFLTTQYLEEADRLADIIAVLDKGKIVATGSPETLKRRVGQDLIELRFASRRQNDRARAILGSRVIEVSSIEHSLTVASDGSARSMRELLDKLAEAESEPEFVSLRKPTIDDVFLTLTSAKSKEGK